MAKAKKSRKQAKEQKQPEPELKTITFVSEMPLQKARTVNRPAYDDMRLQGFILEKRIRNIQAIGSLCQMKPERGYLVTTYSITYLGE